MHYALSGADRSPLPSSFGREDRYRGYRAADRQQPYAGYFREHTLPVQPHVRAAIDGGRAPSGHGYGVSKEALIFWSAGASGGVRGGPAK